MKVLVTGADGFIGSHLVEILLKNGYSVKALSQYNSFNNWGWLEDINCIDEIEVVSGDIRDLNFCNTIVKDVEIIFHLAALIAIPFSYIAPDSYIETNITGTSNILQAAKNNGNIRVIHTSTSEVYGTAQYIPIDENHPLQAQSPYSATKIGADSIAMSFFNSFDQPISIARPFNTYGPRQSARAIIPTIITQISSGCEEISLGDLSPTRDFNYVTDTCSGFIEIAKTEASIGEVINIGSGHEISMLDTLNTIKELMNSNVTFLEDERRIRPEKSEVFRLVCDNKKITNITGFKSQVDIRTGLQKTIEWFSNKNNLMKYKPGIYNV